MVRERRPPLMRLRPVVRDASTGEFKYTLRGGGKDNVFNMKSVILIA